MHHRYHTRHGGGILLLVCEGLHFLAHFFKFLCNELLWLELVTSFGTLLFGAVYTFWQLNAVN